jgi:hypothetical protein
MSGANVELFRNSKKSATRVYPGGLRLLHDHDGCSKTTAEICPKQFCRAKASSHPVNPEVDGTNRVVRAVDAVNTGFWLYLTLLNPVAQGGFRARALAVWHARREIPAYCRRAFVLFQLHGKISPLTVLTVRQSSC